MKKTKRKPENLMKKEFLESYGELKKSVIAHQEREQKKLKSVREK
jgi:hypothetical protein